MQRLEAAPYLPHEGVMRLVDEIGECGVGYAAIRADNPFLRPDGLPAWVGLEYMAQTVAAAHNLRLARPGAARPGVITSFKDLEFAQEWLDPALALIVRTELVHEEQGHAVHRCHVWQGGDAAAPAVSATVYTKENET